MYNLEATPAEGATTRFAREDKKRYIGIIQAGTPDAPFYTNSSQLPVGYTDDPFEALDLQARLPVQIYRRYGASSLYEPAYFVRKSLS